MEQKARDDDVRPVETQGPHPKSPQIDATPGTFAHWRGAAAKLQPQIGASTECLKH